MSEDIHPVVGIIMGSQSDWPIMKNAAHVPLNELRGGSRIAGSFQCTPNPRPAL